MTQPDPMNPVIVHEAITELAVTYQLQVKNTGGKNLPFTEGTWFQTGGMMHEFKTVQEVADALVEYKRTGQYGYLPLRIVQITAIATVIQEVY